jgi:hypothetical protein
MQITASQGMSQFQSSTTQIDQRRPPPPKEQPSGVIGQASSDPEVSEFLQTVRDASINGTFDAKALAEQAPDALKMAAEEHGMDLAELFQRKHDAGPQNEAAGLSLASRFSQLQFSASDEGELMSALQGNSKIQTRA